MTAATVDTVIEDARWTAADLDALADRAVGAALSRLAPGPREVVVMGCDDARIAALNADFRDRPRATNVLSWPSVDRAPARPGDTPAPTPDEELGDIAISYDTCRAEADAAGIPLAQHATHLLVHATLHLLGYDHETDADADLMERTEAEILAGLGQPDPYA